MLYKIHKEENSCQIVKKTTLADLQWKEEDLENVFIKNINIIIDRGEFIIISQETKGKEIPDIMALDRNGDLYIFELKRWKSDSENMLQVLRYGQIYGNSTYDDLNRLYKKNYNSKDNLKDYFEEYFDSNLDIENYNRKQHFIVVTNGLDAKTINAILYWKKTGLDVDAILYWVYKIGEQSFIEFNMYSPLSNYKFNNNVQSYIVNTNKTNSQKDHDSMIKNHKVAAYEDKWKHKIEKLNNGDFVFLYESKNGIVACGKADGCVNKIDIYKDGSYAEYNMKLNDFFEINPVITYQEILKILGHGFAHMQTMSNIPIEDCYNLYEVALKRRV